MSSSVPASGCPGVETASGNAHSTPESVRPYGSFTDMVSSDPQGEESKVLNVRKKSGWVDMDQTLEVRKKLRLCFPSTTH